MKGREPPYFTKGRPVEEWIEGDCRGCGRLVIVVVYAGGRDITIVHEDPTCPVYDAQRAAPGATVTDASMGTLDKPTRTFRGLPREKQG